MFIFNFAVNVRHMTEHLTPQKAAQRAGVGRTTIMRALEREELKAMRDNVGRWKISSDSLDDWVSMRPVRSDVGLSPSTVPDSDRGQELATAKVEIATLKAQKDGLEARLSDAHAERDRLAAALHKSLEARRGFLERIFRLGSK